MPKETQKEITIARIQAIQGIIVAFIGGVVSVSAAWITSSVRTSSNDSTNSSTDKDPVKKIRKYIKLFLILNSVNFSEESESKIVRFRMIFIPSGESQAFSIPIQNVWFEVSKSGKILDKYPIFIDPNLSRLAMKIIVITEDENTNQKILQHSGSPNSLVTVVFDLDKNRDLLFDNTKSYKIDESIKISEKYIPPIRPEKSKPILSALIDLSLASNSS